jgi:stage III sporulation protein AC
MVNKQKTAITAKGDARGHKYSAHNAMNIDVIFRIAGIGILITVVNQVLSKNGRDDMATMVTLAGVIIVLAVVVTMINDFFTTVRTMFQLF